MAIRNKFLQCCRQDGIALLSQSCFSGCWGNKTNKDFESPRGEKKQGK